MVTYPFVFTRDNGENVVMECYKQTIVDRQYHDNPRRWVELQFHPNDRDTKAFYAELSFCEAVRMVREQLLWLCEVFSDLKVDLTFCERVSLNVKPVMLFYVDTLLHLLHDSLSQWGVSLMVELTERTCLFSAAKLQVIYHLYDIGVEFALDDVPLQSLAPSGLDLTNNEVFSAIKVRFKDVGGQGSRPLLQAWTEQGKKVVIQDVETVNQHSYVKGYPIRYWQGFFYARPVPL